MNFFCLQNLIEILPVNASETVELSELNENNSINIQHSVYEYSSFQVQIKIKF